jgi:predicted HicB family RNase H-like nuclease
MYQQQSSLVNVYLLVHNATMEKRPRGRPPVDDGEKLYLTVRVSEERKAMYSRAAAKAKSSLSAWIKGVLDRAAKRVI